MRHDRIDPQPVTLDVRPIELYRDEPGRAEALGAANGRDLVLERLNIVAGLAALVGLLVFVLACLTGCAALERAVPAVGVAHDVARAGCAILAASDGSSADVLAATASMQRSILEAEAERAKGRGVSAETVDGLVATVSALSRVIEANALRVVEAGRQRAGRDGAVPGGGGGERDALITYGCDASRWQGLLNWPKLRDAGIEFAGLRATMGAEGVDPLYVKQRAAAEKAGVLVISYGLIYPRVGTGGAQAAHLARTAGSGAILSGDVEPPDGFPPALAATWRSVVYDFTCEASARAQFPPLIYGSPGFLRSLALPYDMWGAPLWIADWRDRLLPEVPGPWKRETIRQTGLAPSSVSATPLDYDRFDGTLDELRSALSWRP